MNAAWRIASTGLRWVRSRGQARRPARRGRAGPASARLADLRHRRAALAALCGRGVRAVELAATYATPSRLAGESGGRLAGSHTDAGHGWRPRRIRLDRGAA